MAGTDLDAVIRKLAKQQRTTLTAAIKATRERYDSLAARAKDGETRQRYRQIARQAAEEGNAAIRRLQRSADNIADSYARAIRQAAKAATSKPAAPKAATSKTPAPGKAARPVRKTAGSPAKKMTRKTAGKTVKKKARTA